jgi:hypothetical protein
MTRILKIICGAAVGLALAGCEHNGKSFPNFQFTGKVPGVANIFEDAPAIRQPVLPEMLVNCRGHVYVPALGMAFVARGKQPPSDGQFLREERLTPPYRVIPAGARVSTDQSPARLNVELDSRSRIVGFYCG